MGIYVASNQVIVIKKCNILIKNTFFSHRDREIDRGIILEQTCCNFFEKLDTV